MLDDLNPFDLSLADPRHPFHVEHMAMALDEAAVAADEDEVPVGAAHRFAGARRVVARQRLTISANCSAIRPPTPRWSRSPKRHSPSNRGGSTTAFCTSRWNRARCRCGRQPARAHCRLRAQAILESRRGAARFTTSPAIRV